MGAQSGKGKRRNMPKSVRTLSPYAAADLVESNPGEALLGFPDFMKFVGINKAQMLKELQSGRLKSVGVPEGDKIRFYITAEEAINWAANRALARETH